MDQLMWHFIWLSLVPSDVLGSSVLQNVPQNDLSYPSNMPFMTIFTYVVQFCIKYTWKRGEQVLKKSWEYVCVFYFNPVRLRFFKHKFQPPTPMLHADNMFSVVIVNSNPWIAAIFLECKKTARGFFPLIRQGQRNWNLMAFWIMRPWSEHWHCTTSLHVVITRKTTSWIFTMKILKSQIEILLSPIFISLSLLCIHGHA